MNKISNWFHDARIKSNKNLNSLDTDKLSTSPLNDEDNDHTLSTMVPLNSSWFNDTADSDSTNSPMSLSINIASLIDTNQKPIEPVSTPTSSSKKRKSIPQKIITTKNDHCIKSNNE